jgi:hypothetical protein
LLLPAGLQVTGALGFFSDIFDLVIQLEKNGCDTSTGVSLHENWTWSGLRI